MRFGRFSPQSGFSSLPPCSRLRGWSLRRSKDETRSRRSDRSLRHWLSVVKATVIDGEPTAAMLGINFDEAFAETDIAPAIILLGLDGGRYDWIYPDYGDNKEDPAGFERLGPCAKQRTRFIDRMPQS